MRTVIVGAGRAGLSVAQHLQRTGHHVTVLDRDEAVVRRANEEFGIVALVGDGTEVRVLREAGVERADVVVAMLRRDADNLAVTLLARSAGARKVLVRMRDPEYRSVYVSAGVHRILSEADVFVGALATAIEHDAVRHSMVLGAGDAVAFEIEVPPGAAVVGKSVSDIARAPGFPSSCVLAGMWGASGAVEAPRGGSVVEANMTLLLVSARTEIGAVIDFLLRRGGGGGEELP